MKNTFLVAAFCVMTWMVALTSCTDKDEQTPSLLAYPPTLKYPRLIVGSGLDTLPLVSSGAVLESLRDRYAGEWQSRWACIQKPAGAPEPIIFDATSPSARAVGFKPGYYQFEITYSTYTDSRKSTMEVTVVSDKPAGTVVLLDNLNWNVGKGWVTDDALSLINNNNLVFFRGKQKEPAVEYLDPNSNLWVRTSPQADGQADISSSVLRFNAIDHVYFDYRDGSMAISLANVSGNWLDPLGLFVPVRLIY